MTRTFYACLSAALLIPAVVSAQTVNSGSMTGLASLDEPASADSTVVWNIDDCVTLAGSLNETLSVQWSLTIPEGDFQYSVKLDTPTNTCTAAIESDEGCTSLRTAATLAESVTLDFAATVLFGGSITDASSCYESGNGGSFTVMFIYQQENTDGEKVAITSRLTIDMDLDRPTAPTGLEVEAGEDSITASWGRVTAAEGYVVFYSETLESVLTDPPEEISGASSQTVTSGTSLSETISGGITVDTTYFVTVAAESSSGNLSLVSEAVSATTVPTQDFWEIYQGAGGQEAGGCSSTKGTAGWLAFGALGLLALRRRKHVLGVAIALGLLLPGTAQAQQRMFEETPISGAFELKLGRYNPAMDDEFSGSTSPYETTFGSRNPIYLEMEYDVQFWRGFGSFGAFAGLGWHQIKGSALNQDGTVSETDDTRMRMLPLRLGLVYRFDELHRRWDIPFAFSAKVGLDHYVWSIRDANGLASTEIDGESVRGRGATSGYHLAFGAHILLDFVAPRMASSFDLNTGVNNTYFFAELTIAQINDFGSATSWDLSDTTALFGIAFEF